jgi:hypothetical protein
MLRKSVLLMLAFLVVGVAEANATFRIENHLNPAGDPTKITYSVQGAGYNDDQPYVFELVDGDYLSTGPPPGVYTATALLPPGWVVDAIHCDGPRESASHSDFVIDVPNGRVTVTHGATDEHICAFTNRRLAAAGGPSGGVSPTPLPGEVGKVVLSRHPALLAVTPGHGFAKATIRIMRKSIIKARLMRHGRIVGARRLVLKRGTYDIKVPLDRKRMKRMQRRGLDQVTLTFRIIVTARRSGATHVFKHRVIVDL